MYQTYDNGLVPPYRGWEDDTLLPCPNCGCKPRWYDLSSPIDQGMSINQEDNAIICNHCGVMVHRRSQIQTKLTWNQIAKRGD